MYIANNEKLMSQKNILAFMPRDIRRCMYKINLDEAYEIHMRIGRPLTMLYNDGFYFLQSTGVLTKSKKGAVRVSRTHINEALELATKSSLYSKTQNISEGFITVDGGHRIGICGTGVTKRGQVEFIKDISSLCYRLACEVVGAADIVAENVYNNGDVKNTLIISPPGAGKTTMLRDLTRILSKRGIRICIIDERSEIAAVNDGVPSFDLGDFTDILNGVKKSIGMPMVLRSMAPEVIITDEIGTREDAEILKKAVNSGTKIITTIHGYSLDTVKARGEINESLSYFDSVIELSKRKGVGTVEKIWDMKTIKEEERL